MRQTTQPHAYKALWLLAFLTTAACSAPVLDPAYIASHINLRPTWLALDLAPSPDLLLGSVPFRAGVELCNRNDLSVELLEAPWTAELGGLVVGHGAVEGPLEVVANQCTELIVNGKLSLAVAGATAMQHLLTGQIPMPIVEIDAAVRAYGFTLHRQLRLDGFVLRDGGK